MSDVIERLVFEGPVIHRRAGVVCPPYPDVGDNEASLADYLDQLVGRSVRVTVELVMNVKR